MVVPDYQTLMLPLLQAIIDDQVHDLNDIIGVLTKQFKLSDPDLALAELGKRGSPTQTESPS